jgi:glycosyltransferase involved in cell wall biosynthesis
MANALMEMKSEQTGRPLISIITVVFNDAKGLVKTLESVKSQTYNNIEYIIIDGGSSDGTLEIIHQNREYIAFWVSEHDRGIYDAMNKGLEAANGDFVWFMNAGDLIYEPETTEKIFTADGGQADIYYGDTMIVDKEYREVGLRRLRPPDRLSWRSFRKGMLVCHQAILVRRALAEKFDLRYSHSADFDWVIRALKKTGKVINTRLILARFLDGGHSKQNIRPSLKERFHSMKRHYGLFTALVSHIPIPFRFLWFYLRKGRF